MCTHTYMVAHSVFVKWGVSVEWEKVGSWQWIGRSCLILQLLQVTHEKLKTKAITIAIKEYLRKKSTEKILSYQGNLNVEDNWRNLEKEELKEYKP